MSPTKPGRAESAPIEVIAGRYWRTREARDLKAAYRFYCGAYKSQTPLNEFLKKTRLVRFELRNVRIIKTTPVGDRVEVTVSYQFVAPTISTEPLEGRLTDAWAKDRDGEWCKEDEPVLLPFPNDSLR